MKRRTWDDVKSDPDYTDEMAAEWAAGEADYWKEWARWHE